MSEPRNYEMRGVDDYGDDPLTQEEIRAARRRERAVKKAQKLRVRAQVLNEKADTLDPPEPPFAFKFWYRVPATKNPPTLITADAIEYTLDSGFGQWSRVTIPWNAGPATLEEGDEIELEGLLTKKALFFKRQEVGSPKKGSTT